MHCMRLDTSFYSPSTPQGATIFTGAFFLSARSSKFHQKSEKKLALGPRVLSICLKSYHENTNEFVISYTQFRTLFSLFTSVSIKTSIRYFSLFTRRTIMKKYKQIQIYTHYFDTMYTFYICFYKNVD